MKLSSYRLATIVFFCAFIVLPLNFIKLILICAFSIAYIEVCKYSEFSIIKQVTLCIVTLMVLYILILFDSSNALLLLCMLGVISVIYATTWSKKEQFIQQKDMFNFLAIILILNILFLLISVNEIGNLVEVKLLLILIAVQDFMASKLGKLSKKRTNLFNIISPNKTYLGFLGGWGISSTIAIFAGQYFSINSQMLILALFVSMAGDLFYSCVKRANGTKDFGSYLGKKGGMTDRVDSMIISLPIYLLPF